MSQPAFLDAIRDSYDTVAADYVKIVKGPETLDPVSRAMIDAFAELLLAGGAERGPVADVGCGPGWFTARLAAKGLDAFGVDLSPGMIEQARQRFPGLRFEVGSMTALDLPDGTLGGVLAFFSTHHTPPSHLPVVYAELHRVLAPGGLLLLGGHTGNDEHYSPQQAYGGHPVSYESHLVPADRIAELLAAAGFTVTARLEQVTGNGRTHAILLARRSGPTATG
jgi:SAM-dependent methyltransferase